MFPSWNVAIVFFNVAEYLNQTEIWAAFNFSMGLVKKQLWSWMFISSRFFFWRRWLLPMVNVVAVHIRTASLLMGGRIEGPTYLIASDSRTFVEYSKIKIDNNFSIKNFDGKNWNNIRRSNRHRLPYTTLNSRRLYKLIEIVTLLEGKF